MNTGQEKKSYEGIRHTIQSIVIYEPLKAEIAYSLVRERYLDGMSPNNGEQSESSSSIYPSIIIVDTYIRTSYIYHFLISYPRIYKPARIV